MRRRRERVGGLHRPITKIPQPLAETGGDALLEQRVVFDSITDV